MLRLTDKMAREVSRVNVVQVPDGEGGYTEQYELGEPFRAAVVKDTNRYADIAAAGSDVRLYTITSPKGTHLMLNDIIVDGYGRYYKMRSDYIDSETPKCASFQFEQNDAEAIEIPHAN